MYYEQKESGLLVRHKNERMYIEAWGRDSLRVRTTQYMDFTGRDWALSETVDKNGQDVDIHIDGQQATIRNGRLSVRVNDAGVLTFYKDGKMLIREYHRDYSGTECKESRCLKIVGRTYKPIIGGDYQIIQRFEGIDGEKIYGMGQYQQKYLDLKGCVLELAQRNSQVSIPFAVSSMGYGFLWNHPGVGQVSFG